MDDQTEVQEVPENPGGLGRAAYSVQLRSPGTAPERGGEECPMTLQVYRLNAETGEQTELPHVDPSPVACPGLTQNYPPCACPRCLPGADPALGEASPGPRP